MVGTVEDKARQAHRSDAVEGLARVGIASRGLVWLVVGLLALAVLLGGDERTDKGGALRAIADKPLGEVLLLVLVIGFLGYAAWQLLSAAVGHRQEQDAKRWRKRGVSLGKGVIYLALSLTTLQFLLSGGGGEDQIGSRTAQLMNHSGGRTIVGLIGAGLVVAGVVIAVRALREKHTKRLKQYRLPRSLRRPAIVLGIAGLVGHGAVFALIGSFLVRAAWKFDAAQAKGLDAALQALAAQQHGRLLLAVAVAGMLCYALWSFVEAAYRRI